MIDIVSLVLYTFFYVGLIIIAFKIGRWYERNFG